MELVSFCSTLNRILICLLKLFLKNIKIKMKRLLVFLVLVCITCVVFWNFADFDHADFVEVVSDEAQSENLNNLELEKISENEMKKSERINMELKNLYGERHIKCQSNIECEKLVNSVDNYIQRYISLFLITSNLLNHEIKDLKENITIDLEISISGEDLVYLQGYSKSAKGSSYQKNFSKLDAIFSKIARLKKESYMKNAMKSSWSFFKKFSFSSELNNHHFYHFFPFFIILLVTWMVYYYIFHKYFWGFVGILMNSMMLWESLQSYWRKIKEAEVEIYVNSLKSKVMPEDCDPANTRWYHSIVNFFSENKCLHYHKSLMKNPAEEVSLLKCIIDTYSFYLFQTPFRIFGASIRDFTGEISALWPWPFKYLTNLPIAFFFGIIAFLVILILCGKRLKVSFLGAALEIGDVKAVTKAEKRSAISNKDSCNLPTAEFQVSKREPIRIVQKLRPWTKIRFPKRLGIDLRGQRKSLLKASKSVVQVCKEPEQLKIGDSCESLDDYKVKND